MNHPPHTDQLPRLPVISLTILTLALRLTLLALAPPSFHADEGIVALMARHITQGASPVFFYGQPYMGSLNAYLIAAGYSVFGESLLSLRLVQVILYTLVTLTTCLLVWRMTHNRFVLWTVGLLTAIPTPLNVLYTSASIGGYVETLLLGNVFLWLALAFDDALINPTRQARPALSDAALPLMGLVAGLMWWTNGLMIAYVLPVALWVLWRVSRQGWAGWWRILPALVLALILFFVGGFPFWQFNATHQNAALAFIVPGIAPPAEFATIGIDPLPPTQRALGLVLFGIPTLVGMRFPWESNYFAPLIGLIVIGLYVVAFYTIARQRSETVHPFVRWYCLATPLLFFGVFVGSSFGTDPTGRYFLPLALPLHLGLALWLASFWVGGRQRLALAIVALVIGYQAAGQVVAANSATGYTTQFDPAAQLSNADDTALVAFLTEHDLYHGYTTYWIAVRLAFLSGEQLQYSAALPYKPDLSYNPADNRYPPYAAATDAAARVAVVMASDQTALMRDLERQFAAQGITYTVESVGQFTVLYDFSPVKPAVVFR